MKFIVSSSLLLKQLQAISGVLSSNNSLPILDNFLFELADSEIKITASDLETTMIARISVDMAEGVGSVAIPAKILVETLKTFTDIPVTLDIDETHFGVALTAGEGKYKLSGFNGLEYPKIPKIEAIASLNIESDVLYQAINKTLFATSNDDLRPVMAGVFFEIGDEGVTFVATDAHKLVRYRRNDVISKESASFILPKKPLNQLKHILTHDNDTVKVEYASTNARFSFKNVILICRLIEGKYPNYSAVIPASNPNKMTVDRIPFLNSIRRVSIFSNKTTYQVKLRIVGSELTLSAEDLDFSNEARERIACSFEGNDIEIGFNSRFLVEMLQNIDTEQVSVNMSEPNRAGLVLPVDNPNKAEDILMLIMPVMLSS